MILIVFVLFIMYDTLTDRTILTTRKNVPFCFDCGWDEAMRARVYNTRVFHLSIK